jgi:hypothetical protein
METTMRRWFGLILATILVTLSAYGQTFRGAINGTVTDPSGAERFRYCSCADVCAWGGASY